MAFTYGLHCGRLFRARDTSAATSINSSFPCTFVLDYVFTLVLPFGRRWFALNVVRTELHFEAREEGLHRYQVI